MHKCSIIPIPNTVRLSVSHATFYSFLVECLLHSTDAPYLIQYVCRRGESILSEHADRQHERGYEGMKRFQPRCASMIYISDWPATLEILKPRAAGPVRARSVAREKLPTNKFTCLSARRPSPLDSTHSLDPPAFPLPYRRTHRNHPFLRPFPRLVLPRNRQHTPLAHRLLQ
jgi:hypothetical protein